MAEPTTIPEYVAAADEALDETVSVVREMVADIGGGPTSVYMRMAYELMALEDPSRVAGLLSHALVRLAERGL
jgi:hypothetical protein